MRIVDDFCINITMPLHVFSQEKSVETVYTKTTMIRLDEF